MLLQGQGGTRAITTLSKAVTWMPLLLLRLIVNVRKKVMGMLHALTEVMVETVLAEVAVDADIVLRLTEMLR